MNCPKRRSFGCWKDSHMKVHTLVACTFFISRGKWKGHYNDGRSNKDNSVVNWNKCSKQCVQNLFKSSFAGVYGKSLATPSKTQCNMFGCEEAKWKYENWIEHLNCHFWLSLSLSPNEVQKFHWGLQVSHLISSLSFLPNKEWELWRCVLLSNGTYKTLKFWQVLFLGMTKEKKPNLEGLASGLPLKTQRHLDHNFWQEHGCNVSRRKEISPCPVGMCYRATLQLILLLEQIQQWSISLYLQEPGGILSFHASFSCLFERKHAEITQLMFNCTNLESLKELQQLFNAKCNTIFLTHSYSLDLAMEP